MEVAELHKFPVTNYQTTDFNFYHQCYRNLKTCNQTYHTDAHTVWCFFDRASYYTIISSTNFNAQFNNNMYVTILSSTCFGPWHAPPQEEQLHKHSIWYPRSRKRLYTTPVDSSVVYSRLEERGYQMLCLCSCSSWGWACQGPKHVEDSRVTYMLLLNCALKLVEEIVVLRCSMRISLGLHTAQSLC